MPSENSPHPERSAKRAVEGRTAFVQSAMPRLCVLFMLLALAGCSYVRLADPYGNVYGDFYNPGSTYRWQMLACEQAVDDQAVPNPQRKAFLRCCMGAHGVPVHDLASCPATG
jgi:hypothetical protein